jgi:sulfoxide reductase heme-binding subunit YedZ
LKAIAHLKSLIVAATKIAFLKPVIFAAALVPAAVLAYRTYTGENLPANPQEYLTRQTGWWALLFLMVALSVTPVRRLTGWNAAVRLRRMLGLFSFFYAVLHMLTWVVLLNWFDVAEMTKDVVKRPFITVGMATFLILFALALTSNRFAVRRLGKRWQTLHRLVYAAAIAGVVHFWMMVKADVTEPRRWAVLLALLLGFRLYWRWRGTPRTIRTT